MRFPAYPRYRPIGVEWLDRIPENWEVKRLKYSATINDDALAETTDPSYDLRYVDISSVDAVQGIVAEEEMVFEAAPSRARRVVRDGDTIVSTVRTYLRAIAPIRKPTDNLIVSTGFAVVRPRSVNPAFLAYALREASFVETVVARSVGVSYPAVNASEVGTIPIPLPSHLEQQRIADFLDAETAKLDTLMAKKRELIDKLKEKRSALISRTVTRGLPPEVARAAGLNPNPKLKPSGIEWLGEIPEHWEVVQLFRVAAVIQTGPFGSQLHQSDYVDGGVPLINPSHLVDGMMVPDDQETVTEKTVKRLARHCLMVGDVVFARRGEIGRCAVVGQEESGWLCGTGSMVVRLRDCDPSYFARVFRSAGFSALLTLNAVGTTMLNLNPSIVGRTKVPFPPVSEQRAIADYLDRETNKIDLMVVKVEEAIERLQEYRTALITAAVTGKIDVRNVRYSGENRNPGGAEEDGHRSSPV